MDVQYLKPAPDLYLHVIDALGILPAEAIAFEDSPKGAIAAKAAGLLCVAVPNPTTRTFTFPEKVLLLPSLAEFQLEEWIEHLDSK